MERFSDRIGVTQRSIKIQTDCMSEELKVSLWNCFYETIAHHSRSWYNPLLVFYRDYFLLPLTDMPSTNSDCLIDFREKFFNHDWYEIYNFIEFSLDHLADLIDNALIYAPKYERTINFILERELSAYRSINRRFIAVSDNNEIETIENALYESNKYGLKGIKSHFEKSISLLSKKPDPDYRNSIKESISAVEGICKILTAEKSGGIDKALNKLDVEIKIHPALKRGIANLYGYTSDEGGIRHPLIEESDVDFEDAKFMLVSCSALVNFIIGKALKFNLLKEIL